MRQHILHNFQRNVNKNFLFRQVSSADARKVARQFDAAFFEVSAAEESAPVRRIFLEAARAVVRELERCVPLRSLYLEDHSGLYTCILFAHTPGAD